jgi:hypothetical protein
VLDADNGVYCTNIAIKGHISDYIPNATDAA